MSQILKIFMRLSITTEQLLLNKSITLSRTNKFQQYTVYGASS